MRATHAFEEHVGEVQVRIEAPTVAELFAEAGRAFVELVCGDLPPADGVTEQVFLRARDREALLVELLEELVFRAEVDGRVFPQIDVALRSDRELDATLHASRDARPRSHVKAATLHGLSIVDTSGGVSATVVLDV